MPDHSCKLLFSHPEMAAGLLRGFVDEPRVAALDWGAPEKVSGSFVSDDPREDDVVWRARRGEDWLCVYLLLELQSTVDPFMGARLRPSAK